jgi:hypothetical protein
MMTCKKSYHEHPVMEVISMLNSCITGTQHEGCEGKMDELCDWLDWRISDAAWEPTFLRCNLGNDCSKKEYMCIFNSDLRSLAKKTVEIYMKTQYKRHV